MKTIKLFISFNVLNKILFILTIFFIFIINVFSQTQYYATDYHQFNMTNYTGSVTIGMNQSLAQFSTDKGGFQFNNSIYFL